MDNRQQQNPYDVQVGQNLQALRAQSAMTQVDLASKVRAAGMPMSQQTIVKIEQGSRPLRLEEAQQFAAVLGVDLIALTAPVHPLAGQVARTAVVLNYLAEEAVSKAEDWHTTRDELVALLRHLGRGPINPDILRQAEDASTFDLRSALADVLANG